MIKWAGIISAAFLVLSASSAASQNTLKIGVLAPLTGSLAGEGVEMLRAVKLAVADFKATGTIVGFEGIDVVSADSECRPVAAAEAAAKLVGQGVAGVVGAFCSSATQEAAAVLHDAGIVQITPAATRPDLTGQNYTQLLRIIPPSDALAHAVVAFMANRRNAKTMAIIDTPRPGSARLARTIYKAAEDLGKPKIMGYYHIPAGAKDFTFTLASLQRLKPDIVFLSLYPEQGALFMRQLTAMGIKTTVVAGESLHAAAFLRDAGPAAEGIFLIIGPAPTSGNMQKSFKQRYRATWKVQQISPYAYYAYDAATVLLTSIIKAGTIDTGQILPLIKNTAWNGVSGLIRFDAKGDRRPAFRILTVGQGRFIFYTP